MLLALDTCSGPTAEVVILGSADRAADGEVLAGLHRGYVPNKVVAFRGGGSSPGKESAALAGLFQGKEPIPPGPTLFLCESSTCRPPVSGKEAALGALAALARPLTATPAPR